MTSQSTSVDGVPVFWAVAPGERLTATLVFRVGMADETLPTHGISHLVEHLALYPLRNAELAYNGSTGQVFTSFVVAGSPEEVGAHLTAVAGSLAALPFDRIEVESRVLRAEAAQRSRSAYGLALDMRFGPQAFGLFEHEELILHGATPEVVDGWRRRFFHAGNAALWLSGPPPDNLRLDALGPGERVPAPSPIPLPQRTPARVWANSSGISVSFLVSRSVTMTAAISLLGDHLHDRLRDDLGLSYSIGTTQDRLGPDQAHWIVAADCRPEDAADVAGHIQTELSRIRLYGIGEERIDRYRTAVARARADETAAIGEAITAAESHLLGIAPTTPAQVTSELAALTPLSVTTALRVAMQTTLWVVPSGTRFNDLRLHELTWQGPVRHRGQEYLPAEVAPDPEAPPRRLHVGAEGITLEAGEQFISQAWHDIVAAKRWQNGWTLFGRDGYTVIVVPGEWRGGESIDLTLSSRLRPEVVVPVAESLTTG